MTFWFWKFGISVLRGREGFLIGLCWPPYQRFLREDDVCYLAAWAARTPRFTREDTHPHKETEG